MVLYGSLAIARVRGGDPRSRDPVIASIHNLRSADDRLWLGDQPTPDGYRQLVGKLGVKRVVNFRTGDGTDPLGDDPKLLAELGVEYLHLPLHDGHAPEEETVRRFLELVRDSPGPVYAHCGGGVGRSSVMEPSFNQLTGTAGASFPSGHPMAAIALWRLLPPIIALFTHRRLLWWCSVMVSVTIIGLVGLSRVYLGVHWLSDVIAAWVLGALYLLAVEWVLDWHHERAPCEAFVLKGHDLDEDLAKKG